MRRAFAQVNVPAADGAFNEPLLSMATSLVHPAPGLAAAEHAAEGAALNPKRVRTFQRNRRIIGATGIRVENSPGPFGFLAGLHVDENLFAVLVRFRVHR